MSKPLRVILLAAWLGACASTPAQPPPLQTFRLGLLRADYRDYRGGDICAAEPRWLAEELQAPLAIVSRFVRAASQDPDSGWSEEDLALVREAAAGIGPLLEALQWNLAAAGRCSFASKAELAALVQKGPAACEAARRLVQAVPGILDYRQARRSRATWQSGQPSRESQAAQLCARQDATIYYAVSRCDGAQEWLFCDGARVTPAPGQKPEWTPSLTSVAAPEPARPARRRRKAPPPPPKPKAEQYLAATKGFEDVDRCPALPPRPETAAPASR